MRGLSWRSFILLLLGLALVIIAAVGVISAPLTTKELTATADDGVVARIRVNTRRRHKRTSQTYQPQVMFTDAQGHTHLVWSIVWTRSPRHTEGEQVAVRYNPDDPDDGCLIVGDEGLITRNFVIVVTLSTVGFALIVASIVFYIQDRR